MKQPNQNSAQNYDLAHNAGGYREDYACQRIGGALESEGLWE